MLRAVENGVHRLLARSQVASTLAVKIRNQANCVIAFHLGETPNSDKNGEFALVRHLAPHTKVFIDVGANVGSWSDYVLKYSNAKGFLYEPSFQCFGALKYRFRDSNIEIRNVAVSDTPGFSLFAEEENFGETSSLAASRESGDTTRTRSVPVVTLDQDFASTDLPIDFLKIDSEGYDLKVLKGATALLSRTRFLQFEYNSYWIPVGSTLANARRFLQDLGFSIYLIRSTGLHPLRYDFWNDYFRYSNYFACRPADIEIIRPLIKQPI
jgi:FkbM family methyltransferase